jgi:hypothetical protein
VLDRFSQEHINWSDDEDTSGTKTQGNQAMKDP